MCGVNPNINIADTSRRPFRFTARESHPRVRQFKRDERVQPLSERREFVVVVDSEQTTVTVVDNKLSADGQLLTVRYKYYVSSMIELTVKYVAQKDPTA
jgi:hypothetical protein